MTEHIDRHPRPERLVVAGIELEVSNPALAASLAGGQDAVADDMTPVSLDHRAVAEAVPGAVVALPTPRTGEESRVRRELKARVGAAGVSLGFDVGADGTWHSGTGVTILTRWNERSITPAAAAHFVSEIAGPSRPGYERGAVLFVVAHPEAADSFCVAIRNRGAGDLVRAVTIDDLERLCGLMTAGSIMHADVVAVLAPVAAVDAGVLVETLARISSLREA